jgi:hypothetical protein
MLLPNPEGNYRFLPGGEPYSSGVVADPGFEIVHVTLERPLPYRDGFGGIERHLRAAGRERAALCAVELRSPAPFTRAGFMKFNVEYRALLDEWGLLVDRLNPVARTNVAPQWNPPTVPSLHGYSYTVPAPAGVRPTFVVAGAGDLRGGPTPHASIVREGETSAPAMSEKASYVVEAMRRRLAALGAGWEQVTVIDLYTVQPVEAILGPAVLDAIGPATACGLRWYHARPPIEGLEFEMDVRGVRREEVTDLS